MDANLSFAERRQIVRDTISAWKDNMVGDWQDVARSRMRIVQLEQMLAMRNADLEAALERAETAEAARAEAEQRAENWEQRAENYRVSCVEAEQRLARAVHALAGRDPRPWVADYYRVRDRQPTTTPSEPTWGRSL